MKTYHICLSSAHGVMFRNKRDYIYGINCLCLATYKTEASLLAYTFMSNHVHIGVRCENPKGFIKIFRYSYSKYFNRKYRRSGRLGERNFYQIEIRGLHHILTAIAYILRNPLHHGVTSTPFGYKFSSIKAIFSKELGREPNINLMPKKYQYIYLPKGNTLPPCYKMNTEGLIIPESVIDVLDVEHQFTTARAFLYYMNRISGDDWEREQLKDGLDDKPITLNEIEKGIPGFDYNTMLKNEYGKANYNAVSDIDLCYEIDKVILPTLQVDSVYNLSEMQYKEVVRILRKKLHIPNEQLKRCLPIQ